MQVSPAGEVPHDGILLGIRVRREDFTRFKRAFGGPPHDEHVVGVQILSEYGDGGGFSSENSMRVRCGRALPSEPPPETTAYLRHTHVKRCRFTDVKQQCFTSVKHCCFTLQLNTDTM
jgi:hypothetical protein